MRTNSKLLVLIAGLLAITVLVWFSASIQAEQKTYEIHPEVILPGYGTAAIHTIDPYGRLIQRHIDQAERNLDAINTNVQDILEKLDSIDTKLKVLSSRTKRIEKALGISQPKKSTTRQRRYREQQDICCPAPKRPHRHDCPHQDLNY